MRRLSFALSSGEAECLSLQRLLDLLGFIILNMKGAFVGYIQTVCIAPEWRSTGIGSLLLKFAEDRILSEFCSKQARQKGVPALRHSG